MGRDDTIKIINKNKRKVIAVVGPTASGKTGLGVLLAKKFNGEIVSADSRQVYRKLDIGTAKEGMPCGETRNSKLETRNKLKISNKNFQNDTCCHSSESWNPGNHQTGSQIPFDCAQGLSEIEDKSGMTNNIEYLKKCIRYIDNIPQWMIDIVDPEEKFTLFDYLPLARAAIEDIFSRGKVVIIVGGTGLYIQALAEGFHLDVISSDSEKSHVPEDLSPCSAHLALPTGQAGGGLAMGRDDKYKREQLNEITVEELQNILKDLDLEAFEKVDRQNPHRLIRAIEKAQSGEVVTKIKPDFDVLQIGLDWPREELYSRIDQRVDERFEQGMLEEVEELLKSGVDPEWLLGLGLEYRIITQFLLDVIPDLIRNPENKQANQFTGSQISSSQSGMTTQVTIKFGEMKQELKLRSHQYAKRQLTWFRRFPEIVWEKNSEDAILKAKRFASG